MNNDYIKFLREHYNLDDLPAYPTSEEEEDEWYGVFFDLQGGTCPICKCKVSDNRNRRKGSRADGEHRFDIDHDHVRRCPEIT